jgi:hypothetical protein
VQVFVPAGATLESLQLIPARSAVHDRLWGDAEEVDDSGGGNLLQAWLLEAALVSPEAYVAHGQLVCNSRLRRCGSSYQPRPQAICEVDCMAAFAAKLDHGEVSNDLLREFDGVSFGHLFQAEVVCGWRLLPKGFLATASVSGLDLFNADRLQSILGVDFLLASAAVSGSKANFGQSVYAAPEEYEGLLSLRQKCFTFASTESDIEFDAGLHMAKALSEVRSFSFLPSFLP